VPKLAALAAAAVGLLLVMKVAGDGSQEEGVMLAGAGGPAVPSRCVGAAVPP